MKRLDFLALAPGIAKQNRMGRPALENGSRIAYVIATQLQFRELIARYRRPAWTSCGAKPTLRNRISPQRTFVLRPLRGGPRVDHAP